MNFLDSKSKVKARKIHMSPEKKTQMRTEARIQEDNR